jgi:hypothetical protein
VETDAPGRFQRAQHFIAKYVNFTTYLNISWPFTLVIFCILLLFINPANMKKIIGEVVQGLGFRLEDNWKVRV